MNVSWQTFKLNRTKIKPLILYLSKPVPLQSSWSETGTILSSLGQTRNSGVTLDSSLSFSDLTANQSLIKSFQFCPLPSSHLYGHDHGLSHGISSARAISLPFLLLVLLPYSILHPANKPHCREKNKLDSHTQAQTLQWLPSAQHMPPARPWPRFYSCVPEQPFFLSWSLLCQIASLHSGLCSCCPFCLVSSFHNLVMSQPLVTSLDRPFLITFSFLKFFENAY